jgi:serine/threonine-protein kinase
VLRERYELHERIGSGASGTVYRGFDRKRKRRVAVKVLHARHARDRAVLEAFAREASAAERMVHPNLVQVYGYGHDTHGHLFIVMELLQGRTLEDVLRETPRPQVAWAVQVVSQVLSALDAAHDAGVVHRDAKPANVLVLDPRPGDDGPRVKLCDFGVARIRRASGAFDSTRFGTEPSDTVSGPGGVGRVWGTPEYMAPEQARGHAVHRTADIYACGVMLYEMMTGALPFTGDSPHQVAVAQTRNAPRPPRRLRPELDPALEEVILRAMAKDPSQRFRNAQAMRSALLSVIGDAGDEPRKAPPTVVFQPASSFPPPLDLDGTGRGRLSTPEALELAAFTGEGRRRLWLIATGVALALVAVVILTQLR